MSITFLMTGRILRRGITGTIALLLGLFIFEFVQPMVARKTVSSRLNIVSGDLRPA